MESKKPPSQPVAKMFPTTETFLITKSSFTLQVNFRNGCVYITVFKCHDDNLRLASAISKTQMLFASMALADYRGNNACACLHSFFNNEGWDIRQMLPSPAEEGQLLVTG